MKKPRTTAQTPPDTGPAPEITTQLEQLGGLFFSPIECARIVGRPDLERFASELATGTSEAGQAFQRGRLQAEVAVRTTLLSLAKEGSMQHCKAAISLMERCQEQIEEAR